MINVRVKGKELELKFDFSAFFRANKLFSTNSTQKDGAGALWLAFVQDDPMAVYQALRALLPEKYTDNDIAEVLNDYNDEADLKKFTDQLEEELHQSGFFRRAAEQWLTLTTKYADMGEGKTKTEKIQAKAMTDTLDAMKKSLS